MGKVLTIAAPAKVNLYLAVDGTRNDGYHEVVTVLQALDLHDTITITEADRLTVTCEPDLGLPPCDNLAAVAARVLGGIFDREPEVAIDVRKHIPVGGGLGGGSSDAAAVLSGLAVMWDVAPDDPRLLQAASSVGADVSFFFSGGTALYGGRGDDLVQRLPTPALDIVLVNPGEPIATSAAYHAFDRAPAQPAVEVETMLVALQSGRPAEVASALEDNLTAASVGLVPAVGEALEWVTARQDVVGACMSGSGSTVFGVCASAEAAREAAAAASARGWWATATGASHRGVVVGRDAGAAGKERA